MTIISRDISHDLTSLTFYIFANKWKFLFNSLPWEMFSPGGSQLIMFNENLFVKRIMHSISTHRNKARHQGLRVTQG